MLLDGVALPHIDNVWLHQSIALVAQEPLVFADSVKSNILFGVHRTNVTQVGIATGQVMDDGHAQLQRAMDCSQRVFSI